MGDKRIMKEKQYIRFIELSGISITRKEYEGVNHV